MPLATMLKRCRENRCLFGVDLIPRSRWCSFVVYIKLDVEMYDFDFDTLNLEFDLRLIIGP